MGFSHSLGPSRRLRQTDTISASEGIASVFVLRSNFDSFLGVDRP